MSRFLLKACATATVALASLTPAGIPHARAEVRALLAGVWKFQSSLIPDLRGPENDLTAMETLMRGEGASDITVLRNESVTRTTIETALHALGLRAKPGDWILFYYSGHGAEADATVKGTSDGNRDQFLPLAGFSLDQQDPERFIVDKDFYTWISRYIPPTVQVLMIADACHSGTLHRSVDKRAWAFTPRLAFRGDGTGVTLAARPAPRFPSILPGTPDQPAVSLRRADLPNVMFIGAALDDQLALEASLPAEGAPSRGLLTYSFEQALTAYGADGKSLAGDTDQNGKVTIGELGVYLNSQVRALTGQRQEPTAHFVTGKENQALFQEVAPPRPLPATAPLMPAVYAADTRAQALLGGDKPWRIAAAATQADFVWDYASGDVLRRSGDVIANNVTAAADLRGVIEKWNAMEQLRPILTEGSAHVSIGPHRNGARYTAGEAVIVGLEQSGPAAAGQRYATIFNLASDGTVQTLYPLAQDGDGRLPPGAKLPLLETQAVAPFGADHIVALVTPQAPVDLRALLRSIEGQRSAGRLVAPLRAALAKAGGAGALSVGELYTGR